MWFEVVTWRVRLDRPSPTACWRRTSPAASPSVSRVSLPSRHAVAAVLVAAALLAPSAARANGRFPSASQLVLRPGHADEMALRATFGVLVSSDRGATWDWICESAVGYGTSEDPALSVTAGGGLLASTLEGLAVSSDHGCSWAFAGGGLERQVVVDGAFRPGTAGGAVVVTATPSGTTDAGASLQRVQIFATSDDGAHWSAAGSPIDPSVIPTSVEVAASDAHRMYVTASRGVRPNGTASLFVSTNDGAAWTERPIPIDSAAEEIAFVAAVDPARADRVYVRTSGASGKSRLFVTDDAGEHFRVAYSGGPMLGFALSADATTVYLGGPEDGLMAASANDLHFAQRTALPVGCLAVSGPRIYACVVQSSVLLASSDDDGASFEPLFRLPDLRGPLACPPSAKTASCGVEWSGLKDRFGIGVSDAGANADAAPAPAPLEAAGGGCNDSGALASAWSAAALVTLAAGVFTRRRRSRRAR